MTEPIRKSLSVSIPPWDLPIREYVKTFPMSIAIYDKNDIIIHEETIDYSNPDDRRKLGKMTYWACNEGHTVETSAADNKKNNRFDGEKALADFEDKTNKK